MQIWYVCILQVFVCLKLQPVCFESVSHGNEDGWNFYIEVQLVSRGPCDVSSLSLEERVYHNL